MFLVSIIFDKNIGVKCLVVSLFTHVNTFSKSKERLLFNVFDTYLWIHVFQKQPQKAVLRLFDIESEVLENTVKEFSFSKTAVHLQLY